MGSYFAHNDQEAEEVCIAIKEHYSPQGPSDFCPKAPLSVVLSLADKIDTLVGFFAINEKPTGSKDPFALRRYALGVIRLIMENSLKLPLEKAITKSLSLYPTFDEVNSLFDFIMERLKVYLKANKIGNDRIDSIFSKRNEDDINRLVGKVKAIDLFVASDDGANLITAYRRAANLVSAESKKDGKSYHTDPDEKIFQLEQETYLLEALTSIGIALPSILKDNDFNKAMQVLASLRSPIDSYFENVTVNTDDLILRDNRLRLLSLVVKTMNTVADFSVIEGP